MEKADVKKVKTAVGYAAHARLMAQVEEAGFVRRVPVVTPYSYSPTHSVYLYRGRQVVVLETAHRYVEVFLVPAGFVVRATEAEALADFSVLQKAVA